MGLPVRALIIVLLASGLFVNYLFRVVISSTVGAIAEEHGYAQSTKGLVLSAFFFGYILLQVNGGSLATRYGGLYVLGASMLLASLCSLATPTLAGSPTSLVLIRALTGLAESVCYPAVHAIMGRWAPHEEKSMFVTLVWAGSAVGTAFALPVAGAITSAGGASQDAGGGSTDAGSLLRGWPAAYYLFGLMGIVWSFLWLALASSAPEDHPFISEEERRFIVESRDSAGAAKQDEGIGNEPAASMASIAPLPSPLGHAQLHETSGIESELPRGGHGPLSLPGAAAPVVVEILAQPSTRATFSLSAALLHPAILALTFAHACHNWLWYILLTWAPEFLRDQLGYDFKAAGGAFSVPYLLCAACSIVAGWLADRALARGVTRQLVRKAAQTVGELVPAVCLVACGYLTDPAAVVGMLTLSIGFTGVATAGFGANLLDVAPAQAGVLLGFANTAASVPGIVAPVMVGWLTSGDGSGSGGPGSSIAGWRYAFWLAAGVSVAGWAVFLRWGQAAPIADFSAQSLLRGCAAGGGARLCRVGACPGWPCEGGRRWAKVPTSPQGPAGVGSGLDHGAATERIPPDLSPGKGV